MTANRVISDHSELASSGVVTHSEIDNYVNNSQFVVLSGSAALSPLARKLTAGSGITITDHGAGGTVVIDSTAASAITLSWNEVPTGLIDGSNRTFVFAHVPNPAGSIMVFLNGLKQREGATSDFVLSGSTITFDVTNVPRSGSNIDATYQY